VGPHTTVDLFRRQLRHRTTRSVARYNLRETSPFSFDRLYQLAPAAVRVEPEVPYDPYDVSVWPVRRLSRGIGELRYQLHTRNIELLPFVRLLSKRFRTLTFRLVTVCLDDEEIASYRVCDGGVRRWILTQTRREAHWERARQKFGLTDDKVYANDVAEHFAQESMLEEALGHWEAGADGSQPPINSSRNWWNRPGSRDLKTERSILMTQRAERFLMSKTTRASRNSQRRQKSPR
jgi:hypothetical protein